MELTRLRKQRDDLMEILSDCECDEFDAVDYDLLEGCAKGNEKSLAIFISDFRNTIGGKPSPQWVSVTHMNFYNLCHEIAALEQKTYKEAFQ